MKKRATNFSVYHVVINSNKMLNAEDKVHFTAGANYIFGNRTNLSRYIEAWKHRTDDNENINEHLKKMDVTMGYEVGSNKHRDHVDVTISITHDSCIKLRTKDLRDFFSRVINDKVHIDVKAASDNLKYLQAYSSKDGEVVQFSL